jgi:hypothetical protein
VVPFAPHHGAAVRAFNQRLAAGGGAWRFPETPEPDWLPPRSGARAYQEYFLLLQGEEVRGAYALKHQDASFAGEVKRVGSFYWPLSEGAVNPAYSLVAMRLVQDAERREPLLFGLGMGGSDTQIARLLRVARWRMVTVPLYFKVLNARRFLQELEYLRRSRPLAWLLDLAALSGAGTLAMKVANAVLDRRRRRRPPLTVRVVERFGPWADEVWRACAASYSFVGLRDSGVLNDTYPPGKQGFVRLQVIDRDATLGWAVVQPAAPYQGRHLGDLHVAMVVDALARPEHAGAVVSAAVGFLEEGGSRDGTDLLLSNQSHPAWRAGLREAGFLRGPSAFVFGASHQLGELLAARDPGLAGVHLNRGDGDGPWGMVLAAGGNGGTPQ